ncbi:retropepsin-like aspartic protease family protein [Sphingomonas sp. M1-B02]|uniref:retropepsin-like aspartic protease family protein n=1 Tax=Sphingomonas sp. M1-B02 TaxID=3114300 RepID=UPI00223ED52F|nr:TIGR02281 family clan AA aspartic protease [Sphingomonas sp. S6-11]UZK66930.1 TIGR02281 family clan AA aspartic protease [Sphingomonas sp. S6-11]
MNWDSWDSMDMIWLVAVLVLAVSALTARRLSFGYVLRSLLSWAVIALVAFVAVANRHELGALFASASAKLGLDDQQVDGETVRIRMAPDGHFWARVTLNGVERRMLIDSGATITAISDRTAASADISASGGLPVMIETANGTVAARRGRIDELAIGPLKTSDLGVVVSSSFGELDVLGMNFLSRLHSWRVQGNVLILEPKPEAIDGGSDATTNSAENAPARRRQGDAGRSDRPPA